MYTVGTEDGQAGPLREALMVCTAAGLSGALRVNGNPGGTVFFADGRVAGIETPGAPSAEVLLLRSHRVTESGWDAAFAAAAANGGPMSTELVTRDIVGIGELEALLRIALADAMFVVAAGSVDEVRADPGPADCLLPLEPGAEADLMVAESVRRMKVLAALPGPVRPDRDRVMAAPGVARAGVRVGDGLDEILALADGRRTPRDLAFALGRGVYATMLQIARMHEIGLLANAPNQATADAPGGTPGQLAPGKEREVASGLPRRQRDLPALPRRSGRVHELRAPLGLLRPRSNRDTNPGEMS